MSQTHPLTTTAFELPGFRVVKCFGVVRGIIVRSRSIIGNIGASLQSLVGGNISLYTTLCERTREDAFNQMLAHAGQFALHRPVVFSLLAQAAKQAAAGAGYLRRLKRESLLFRGLDRQRAELSRKEAQHNVKPQRPRPPISLA